MDKQKISEIFKWIAIILVGVGLICFLLGVAGIRDNTFMSIALGVAGGAAGTMGLLFFLIYSPGAIIASIVLLIISAVIIIVFEIINRDTESSSKILDWIGAIVVIISVVFIGIHLTEWLATRRIGLIIGLFASGLPAPQGSIVGLIGILLFDQLTPGVLFYLIGLLSLIAALVILLIARIKQIDVLKS